MERIQEDPNALRLGVPNLHAWPFQSYVLYESTFLILVLSSTFFGQPY